MRKIILFLLIIKIFPSTNILELIKQLLIKNNMTGGRYVMIVYGIFLYKVREIINLKIKKYNRVLIANEEKIENKKNTHVDRLDKAYRLC